MDRQVGSESRSSERAGQGVREEEEEREERGRRGRGKRGKRGREGEGVREGEGREGEGREGAAGAIMHQKYHAHPANFVWNLYHSI